MGICRFELGVDKMQSHFTQPQTYKCCPHWDDVQWPWPGSIPQRSRSHETFKVQSTHARVRAITYVCIDYHLTWYKCCPKKTTVGHLAVLWTVLFV